MSCVQRIGAIGGEGVSVQNGRVGRLADVEYYCLGVKDELKWSFRSD